MPLECAYDLTRTWEENRDAGPRLGPATAPVPPTPLKSFLGLPVASRIGISAGLLPNRKWVLPYARRGFDILTYKTVRSSARACHPFPNWVFVDAEGPPAGPVIRMDPPGPDADPASLSSAVCFGMPSDDPEVWREDVKHTVRALGAGQVLIVSVVASPAVGDSVAAMAADYARCAAWAAESGAHAIEANLSCPNVCSAEGAVYQDPRTTRQVVQALRAAVPKLPILLKIGTFASASAAREFLGSVDGFVDGVTLVNCISRDVLHPDGRPVFGERHRRVGVTGRAIHRPSVDALRMMRAILRADGMDLALVGVGGVSSADDFGDFFEAGADAVLCGSAPMYLPDLAIEVKRMHPEW